MMCGSNRHRIESTDVEEAGIVEWTRWHGNALARLGDAAAVGRLYEALDVPDASLRARAGMRTDLAYALAASDDDDEARVQLRRARDLAEQAASRRQLRRIRQLATQRQYMK